MGVVVFLVLLAFLSVAYVLWYRSLTPERKAQLRADAAEKRRLKNATISQVGVPTSGGGGLSCPKCHGTQFKARRSKKARAGVVATGVVGWAATKQKKVQCVTCGTMYNRG